MEKIEHYFGTDKYRCWECMEDFKSNTKYSDLEECPLCHAKIEKESDMSVNFEKISKDKIVEMFDVIYQSDDIIQRGFDKLNGELLIEWFHDLSPAKRKKIYAFFDSRNIKTIYDFINEHWQDDRNILWKETFRQLSKKKQIKIIETYFRYYERTKAILDDKYDWDDFTCILEEKGERSQLQQIKNNWCELGVQVYDCAINYGGRMCQCLRHANDTTAYKCFRDYLQKKELNPDGVVPISMRYSDK